jgi:hypothetical protein
MEQVMGKKYAVLYSKSKNLPFGKGFEFGQKNLRLKMS